jgi:hypothetical protein
MSPPPPPPPPTECTAPACSEQHRSHSRKAGEPLVLCSTHSCADLTQELCDGKSHTRKPLAALGGTRKSKRRAMSRVKGRRTAAPTRSLKRRPAAPNGRCRCAACCARIRVHAAPSLTLPHASSSRERQTGISSCRLYLCSQQRADLDLAHASKAELGTASRHACGTGAPPAGRGPR